jgi:hypothetical protein
MRLNRRKRSQTEQDTLFHLPAHPGFERRVAFLVSSETGRQTGTNLAEIWQKSAGNPLVNLLQLHHQSMTSLLADYWRCAVSLALMHQLPGTAGQVTIF